MAESMRNKAVGGMAWTGFEKLALYAFHFIVGIIIARILMPSDYGIIGMLAIFMAIAQTFLDSGFASALIQKKDRTNVDYSTVFYFNLVVAILLYGVFYMAAPYIANFYNMPILKDVARVVSLSLIINGLSVVQTARLSIELNFRLQSVTSITSYVLSGAVGIILAYSGWGVWALVLQGITASTMRTVILWLFSHWHPIWVFSIASFKRLFSFGSKLLCSSLINTIYQNLYTLVIGKCFNAADVGFFSRGNHFSRLPCNVITETVVKVNYPILSRYQDDHTKLINAYKKLFRLPIYILYPTLSMMMAVAYPLIEFLLGVKWLPCVPILQILCLGYMWSPLTSINLNLLYVKGRSDLVLKLEFIKKPIAFLILIASIPFGIWWMCVGRALYFFIAFVFNCYYTGKILNYGFVPQIKEIIPILINCVIMYGVITLVMMVTDIIVLKLVVGILLGLVSLVVFSLVTKDESFYDLKDILLSKIGKKK